MSVQINIQSNNANHCKWVSNSYEHNMKYEISIDSQWSIKSMLSGSEYYKFTVYQYKDSISYYSKHYFNSQSHGFNIITTTIIKIAQLSHMLLVGAWNKVANRS